MKHFRFTRTHLWAHVALIAFPACAVLSLAPDANAGPIAFADSAGGLGTLDLSTGVFTLLGTSVTSTLGEVGGSLYAQALNGGQLVNLSPVDGTPTPIGALGNLGSIDGIGSTNGGLFGTNNPGGGSSFDLYSIDPSTGTPTVLGPTGIDDTGSGSIELSTGSSTLYFDYSIGGGSFAPVILYSLNTTTGAATEIGDTGIDRIDGMAFIEGTLYASALLGATSGNYLYKLNTTTGQATEIAAITGLPASGPNYGLGGLAPDSPEPSTLVLSVAAIAFVSLRRRPADRGRDRLNVSNRPVLAKRGL